MNPCRYCGIMTTDEYCSDSCYDGYQQELVELALHNGVSEMYAEQVNTSSDGPSYQAALDAQNNHYQNETGNVSPYSDLPF